MIETTTAQLETVTAQGSSVAVQRLVLSSSVTLWLGDCRDVAPLLAPGSFDVLVADPPYGMGKEKDGVMHDNLYRDKLDAFLMECWKACRPSLKDNASAYVWGEAQSLWRLWYLGGLADSEPLTMRNEVVWDKGSGQGISGERHRQYVTATERALFFMLGEQGFNNNADNYWEGWEPLRRWMCEQREASGLSNTDIKRAWCEWKGVNSTSQTQKWFSTSCFGLITEEAYLWLRALCGGRAFNCEHNELKREHDELKREFYSTRCHFDNTHQCMTDVWNYPRVTGAERNGHPTPKPVAMMARSVKTSCPEGGAVLDPFMGRAPTAIACIRTGRRFVGIEKDPEHFDGARQRIEAELGQGDLFRREND
jgi:DNA modification methylase